MGSIRKRIGIVKDKKIWSRRKCMRGSTINPVLALVQTLLPISSRDELCSSLFLHQNQKLNPCNWTDGHVSCLSFTHKFDVSAMLCHECTKLTFQGQTLLFLPLSTKVWMNANLDTNILGLLVSDVWHVMAHTSFINQPWDLTWPLLLQYLDQNPLTQLCQLVPEFLGW